MTITFIPQHFRVRETSSFKDRCVDRQLDFKRHSEGNGERRKLFYKLVHANMNNLNFKILLIIVFSSLVDDLLTFHTKHRRLPTFFCDKLFLSHSNVTTVHPILIRLNTRLMARKNGGNRRRCRVEWNSTRSIWQSTSVRWVEVIILNLETFLKNKIKFVQWISKMFTCFMNLCSAHVISVYECLLVSFYNILAASKIFLTT